MTTIHPDSTEEFEYIQTPAAPEQTKPAFDCGVPTTLVSTAGAIREGCWMISEPNLRL